MTDSAEDEEKEKKKKKRKRSIEITRAVTNYAPKSKLASPPIHRDAKPALSYLPMRLRSMSYSVCPAVPLNQTNQFPTCSPPSSPHDASFPTIPSYQLYCPTNRLT